jgi:multimeric flavodoxin WrbA
MTQTMKGRVLGLSAGNPGGNVEIALKAALRAAEAEGAEVELVRLEELTLSPKISVQESDDLWWLWDRLLECDGLIVAAPIYSRTPPASLKILMDRLLGPNADRAIVEKLVTLRASGVEPAVPFRLDERVLRHRVGGLIAVGGALTPQWQSLALPVLHTMTFSMQTAVVDQLLIRGAGTPRSVVLDEDALARAATLGQNVARQLGRSFEEAEYVGEPGLCPMCHLSVVDLRGHAVMCATCGARGTLAADGTVAWTDLDASVISMVEKRAHYDEILQTAARHAEQHDIIDERAASFAPYDPVVRPDA